MTPNPPLDEGTLAALASFSTPTLANAIEAFGVRPADDGFAGSEIRCLFPELGPMVGHAATVRIRAAAPGPPEAGGDAFLRAYWRSILATPSPTVVVVEDLDPVPIGALIGEVNANVYSAMGCVGTVMRGGVRDLDEMRQLGFHAFASDVLVSRAHVHVVDFGRPVRIGRLEVRPGDLLHADRHGVLLIPTAIAAELPPVARKIERLEREIIDYARREDFTIDGLAEVWHGAVVRAPKPRAGATSAGEHP